MKERLFKLSPTQSENDKLLIRIQNNLDNATGLYKRSSGLVARVRRERGDEEGGKEAEAEAEEVDAHQNVNA